MARKANLRAVAADEKPAKPEKPKKLPTLAEAVASGDYREILLAQQREIATSLPDEKGPAKAALHRQLAAISKELEAMKAAADQEAAEDGEVEDEAFDASAI